MKTQKEKRQDDTVGSSPHPESFPVPSQTLFKNATELVIEHAGQYYRLRITRQNKLILTK